jgi:hypothetical protein
LKLIETLKNYYIKVNSYFIYDKLFYLFNLYKMSTSLADLLAGYSAEINARVEHNTEQEQNNADRKAKSIEDVFQSAKDNLESLGGEVAGAGAAIHLGRKVYKKYQEKYGKDRAEDPSKNSTGQEDNGNEGRNANEGGSGNDGATDTAGQGGGTDNQISSDGTGNVDANQVTNQAADDAANNAASGDSSGTDPAAGDSGSAGTSGATADDAADVAQAAVDAPAASAGDITTTVGDEVAQGARTATGMFGGIGSGGAEFGDEGADALGQALRIRPTQIVQYSQTPQSQAASDGSAPTPPDAATPPDAPPPSAAAADDAADAAENAARQGTGMFENLASNVGDAANSVKGGIANMGKQLGQKLGITAGEEAGGETGGLLTTEAIFDSLGPVTEVGGAILSLIGLFEGLFHHPKPVTEKAADAPVETQVGGIDPTALAQKTPAVNTVV